MRLGYKDVDRLVPGDLVYFPGPTCRRVAHRERLQARPGEYFPPHVVFFTDGSTETYDRGYKSVEVVIPDLSADRRPDGVLEHP